MAEPVNNVIFMIEAYNDARGSRSIHRLFTRKNENNWRNMPQNTRPAAI
jgi:hypothetical protein